MARPGKRYSIRGGVGAQYQEEQEAGYGIRREDNNLLTSKPEPYLPGQPRKIIAGQESIWVKNYSIQSEPWRSETEINSISSFHNWRCIGRNVAIGWHGWFHPYTAAYLNTDSNDDDDPEDNDGKCDYSSDPGAFLFGIFIASLRLSYCTGYHLHCTK